jgi:hypothetical protein
MTISLMTYVPYDTVLWGIIDIVQGYRNFRYAKTGGQMAWVDG